MKNYSEGRTNCNSPVLRYTTWSFVLNSKPVWIFSYWLTNQLLYTYIVRKYTAFFQNYTFWINNVIIFIPCANAGKLGMTFVVLNGNDTREFLKTISITRLPWMEKLKPTEQLGGDKIRYICQPSKTIFFRRTHETSWPTAHDPSWCDPLFSSPEPPKVTQSIVPCTIIMIIIATIMVSAISIRAIRCVIKFHRKSPGVETV